MAIITNESALILWRDAIQQAEARCAVKLNHELEAYLISVLMHYTDKPEIAKQVFAKAFLEAMQTSDRERVLALKEVGDQCLLYAGLYPRAAERKLVKVTYFVGLGRSAYATLSTTANDIFWRLAYQFVSLMDVLQSIRNTPDLLPLEAYEQWQLLDSQRALQVLHQYTKGHPYK